MFVLSAAINIIILIIVVANKKIYFLFSEQFPNNPHDFFKHFFTLVSSLSRFFLTEWICVCPKESPTVLCFSIWKSAVGNEAHETKNIKQQKKSILLAFVFFLPFLVFSQQGRRPDISNYLSFLSLSRSDGGMLLDHKVVVAHIFLLCCWTWNEEKMDKAKISFSPGGCYFSWRLMWSVMIEVKWQLMIEVNEITPKFWNKAWIMNSQDSAVCCLCLRTLSFMILCNKVMRCLAVERS